MNFHEECKQYRIMHIGQALEKAFYAGYELQYEVIERDVKQEFKNFVKNAYGVEI